MVVTFFNMANTRKPTPSKKGSSQSGISSPKVVSYKQVETPPSSTKTQLGTLRTSIGKGKQITLSDMITDADDKNGGDSESSEVGTAEEEEDEQEEDEQEQDDSHTRLVRHVMKEPRKPLKYVDTIKVETIEQVYRRISKYTKDLDFETFLDYNRKHWKNKSKGTVLTLNQQTAKTQKFNTGHRFYIEMQNPEINDMEKKEKEKEGKKRGRHSERSRANSPDAKRSRSRANSPDTKIRSRSRANSPESRDKKRRNITSTLSDGEIAMKYSLFTQLMVLGLEVNPTMKSLIKRLMEIVDEIGTDNHKKEIINLYSEREASDVVKKVFKPL